MMTVEPSGRPSEQIAASLRARISRGELTPGDRLPSTRQLVREWGVAVATASRALAMLQDEGLAVGVPGVGTIVQPTVELRPPEPTRTRARRRVRSAGPAALDPGLVITTAVAIADAEGLDAVSMRRVAAEIGTGVMSLYRHVADKDDLVLQMIDAVLREWRPPATDDSGWQDRLEAGSWQLWTVFRRHPWAASALSLTRPQPVAGGLAYAEWVLATLDTTGLDRDASYDLYVTIFAYVRGAAINLETEASAEAASGVTSDEYIASQAERRRQLVADGNYPHFHRLITSDYDFDIDRLFQRGLQYLLDGVAASLR